MRHDVQRHSGCCHLAVAIAAILAASLAPAAAGRAECHQPCPAQVPTNNSHSTMLWHEWVVLIAGSIGSALRAVRPPNLHITPVVRRDLGYRASATGSLYRSPLAIMAQTIRAILLASAMAATLVGRLASKAVSQGRCFVPWSWRNG